MAYVKTGFLRSFSVEVTKKINGIVQAGYPKTYPTAVDVANGYFTYSGSQYTIPTANELAMMDSSTYQNLLAMLKLYVVSLEPGLNWETATVITAAEYYDPVACVPGEGTTTTTTTTTSPTTTTTTIPVSTSTSTAQTLYPFCVRLSNDIETHCDTALRTVVWLDSQYFSAPHRAYLDPYGYVLAANSYNYIDCTFGDGVTGVIFDFGIYGAINNAVGVCTPDTEQLCNELTTTTTTTGAPTTTTTTIPVTTTTTTADPLTSYPFCVRLSNDLETHCSQPSRTLVYGDRSIFATPCKLYFDAGRTYPVNALYAYVDHATEGDVFDFNVDGSLKQVVKICEADIEDQCATTTTTLP